MNHRWEWTQLCALETWLIINTISDIAISIYITVNKLSKQHWDNIIIIYLQTFKIDSSFVCQCWKWSAMFSFILLYFCLMSDTFLCNHSALICPANALRSNNTEVVVMSTLIELTDFSWTSVVTRYQDMVKKKKRWDKLPNITNY